MPPKKNWKKHFYGKLSGEKSLQNNFQKKPLPRNIWRKIYCTKKYLREISTKRYSKIRIYPNMSEGKFSTKQDVKRNSLPNKLWIGTPSKQIPKETSTKECLKKYIYIYLCLPNIFWRRISTKKIFEENSLPRKKSFEKCLDQHFSQKILARKLWRDIPCKKLKRNPYHKVSQETFPQQKKSENTYKGKNIRREISAKKWRNISTIIYANNHNKKHGKNQNWWILREKRVFIKFHQFRFLPCFGSKNNLIFWCGDVS